MLAPLSSPLLHDPALQVLETQFEIDWSRVSSKVRFRKMVTRQDQGLKDQAELERELMEVCACVCAATSFKMRQV